MPSLNERDDVAVIRVHDTPLQAANSSIIRRGRKLLQVWRHDVSAVIGDLVPLPRFGYPVLKFLYA